MKQLSETEALHRAAAYCSTAERCIQDVKMKILTAGLSEEVAERIISHLIKEKFIDESRFSRSFVNDKLRFNKWGRVKIGYELRKKNISSLVFSEALAGIDEVEYKDILLSLLKAKKKGMKGKNEQDIFNKLLRFAAGRGFESKEAIQCLRQLGAKSDDYETYME